LWLDANQYPCWQIIDRFVFRKEYLIELKKEKRISHNLNKKEK